MQVSFLSLDTQVMDRGLKKGDITEVQLEITPICFGLASSLVKEKSPYFQRLRFNLYDFAGKILKTAIRDDFNFIEVLVDCGIPMRVRTYKFGEILPREFREKEVYHEGDIVMGHGYMYGFVSFDKAKLSMPIYGNITEIEKIELKVLEGSFYLITLDISSRYSKPKISISVDKPLG